MGHSIMRYLIVSLLLLGFVHCNSDDPAPDNTSASALYFPPSNSSDWETVTPAALGWNADASALLDEYVTSSNTRALIILKDGRIAYEKYHGQTLDGSADFTTSNYWYWASAGKTLTAFLIGKLEAEGKLALDDPSNMYLSNGWSSLTAAQENAITVRHHLTMTTGLDYTVPDVDCTDPECLLYLNTPGTAWFYHNAPYTRLDGVIQGASSQSFDAYFNAVLKNPIGMEGLWAYSGYNHIFYSPPRSMARFGLLILAKGYWEGQDLLGNEGYYSDMISTSQSINLSYGYLWWLNGKGSFIPPLTTNPVNSDLTPSAPDEMVAAMGKNGQVINIVPSENLVVVRMGELPDDTLVPFLAQDDLWKVLNAVMQPN